MKTLSAWTYVIAIALVAGSDPARAQTPTIVGSLANFDVVNDTESEKEGFEIQLENVQIRDVTRVFGQSGAACYIRYCIGSVTAYPPAGAIPGGVIIRWAARYDAVNQRFVTPATAPGGGSSGTPSVFGVPHPFFSGEQCWSLGQGAAYPSSGCEHFGVSLAFGINPTKTVYRWLHGDPITGQFAPAPNSPPVAVAQPIVAVIPPAAPGGLPEIQAQIAGAAPVAVNPPLPHRYGLAQWVKVYKTELGREADLDELVGGHPNDVVPNAQHQGETETEWKLLQLDVTNPDNGSSALRSHGSPHGGSRAVLRRYEFYKYTGAVVAPGGTSGKNGVKLSTDDQEQSACARDAKGECIAPGPGELGDYIGAQMVAQNLQHGIVPTITWPAPAPIGYGTALSGLQLNAAASDAAGADIPGAFAYTPALGTIAPVGVQTLQVTFTPADPAAYDGQTKLVQITVNKAAQTIAFDVPADQVYSEFAFSVIATGGGSGNAVTFVASGTCTVSGNQVTATGVGTCTLTASQAGDANFEAAESVVRSFKIVPAPLQITAANATKVYGTVDPALTYSAAGFQGSDSAASTLTGDLARAAGEGVGHYAINQGTLAASANYSIVFTAATLDITPAAQTIVFAALPDRTMGDAPFAVTATGGGSGNPVTFSASGTCTVAANVVTLTAAGGCTVVAAQDGDANYSAASPVARSFTIAAAPTVNLLVNPGPQTNTEGDKVELELHMLIGERPALTHADWGDDDDDRDDHRRAHGVFSAAHLPDGLHVEKTHGVIRGRLRKDSAGEYLVTVMFSRGGETFTQQFTWTVREKEPKGTRR